MKKIRQFELVNGTPICPVCGIKRTAIRNHIALAANQERKRHITDKHWKFYEKHTTREVITRWNWHI